MTPDQFSSVADHTASAANSTMPRMNTQEGKRSTDGMVQTGDPAHQGLAGVRGG